MTKINKYKYLGLNGILITRILLEDVKHYPLIELKADSGMILTNGETTTYSVTISPEEVDNWREIEDKVN